MGLGLWLGFRLGLALGWVRVGEGPYPYLNLDPCRLALTLTLTWQPSKPSSRALQLCALSIDRRCTPT